MTIKRLSFFIIAFIFILLICINSPLEAAKKDTYQTQKKQSAKALSARKKAKASSHVLKTLSKHPYSGAIVVDASTGSVLFQDNPDFKGYPASLVKMMNLLVILEAVKAKHINLEDTVTISAEVRRIGGSQVYLKENEVHTVDNLIYALMIKSANDAATALALHYKGNKHEFVSLMNKRAKELGMKDTVFHSVHGLPPGKGQLPDISTPRDMAKLSMALLKHPEALKYTSVKKRFFRTDSPEPMVMYNHNHLIGTFEGCDGLKTGYFRAAGFSISATAVNENGRAVAVVLGSVDRKIRDTHARKLLSKSLMKLAENPTDPGFSFVYSTTASSNEQEQN